MVPSKFPPRIQTINPDRTPTRFGRQLILLRHFYSTSELARLLDVNPATILFYINGRRRVPPIRMIRTVRKLETLHAAHIRLLNQGIRPEFIRTKPVAR